MTENGNKPTDRKKHEEPGTNTIYGKALKKVKTLIAGCNQKFIPKCDISEDEQFEYIKADLPGVNKNDIDIIVDNKVLTIIGRRMQGKHPNHEKNLLSERQYGDFKRDFSLRDNVDVKNIKTDLRKGILTLKLPKVKKDASNIKKIDIQMK